MAEYVYSQITAPDSYFRPIMGTHSAIPYTDDSFFEHMIETIETGTTDGRRKIPSPFDLTDTWDMARTMKGLVKGIRK